MSHKIEPGCNEEWNNNIKQALANVKAAYNCFTNDKNWTKNGSRISASKKEDIIKLGNLGLKPIAIAAHLRITVTCVYKHLKAANINRRPYNRKSKKCLPQSELLV